MTTTQPTVYLNVNRMDPRGSLENISRELSKTLRLETRDEYPSKARFEVVVNDHTVAEVELNHRWLGHGRSAKVQADFVVRAVNEGRYTEWFSTGPSAWAAAAYVVGAAAR